MATELFSVVFCIRQECVKRFACDYADDYTCKECDPCAGQPKGKCNPTKGPPECSMSHQECVPGSDPQFSEGKCQASYSCEISRASGGKDEHEFNYKCAEQAPGVTSGQFKVRCLEQCAKRFECSFLDDYKCIEVILHPRPPTQVSARSAWSITCWILGVCMVMAGGACSVGGQGRLPHRWQPEARMRPAVRATVCVQRRVQSDVQDHKHDLGGDAPQCAIARPGLVLRSQKPRCAKTFQLLCQTLQALHTSTQTLDVFGRRPALLRNSAQQQAGAATRFLRRLRVRGSRRHGSGRPPPGPAGTYRRGDRGGTTIHDSRTFPKHATVHEYREK